MALIMSSCTGMGSPRELTDDEKERVIEIALNTSRASEWLEGESEYRIQELNWYAIQGRGTWWGFEYDSVQTDPHRQLIPESVRWYPGVTIAAGGMAMKIAVDLRSKRGVMMHGPYSPSNLPDRYREPKPPELDEEGLIEKEGCADITRSNCPL